MIFVCDESGAKGYADKDENSKCEFGLFAGYFLKNKKQQEDVKKLLGESFNKIEWPNSKKHVNELKFEKDKQLIIDDVFSVFREEKIDCLYEGGYVHDFHISYSKREKILKRIEELKKSKIRITKHKDKSLLHDELFRGLFVRAITYYEEFKNKDGLEINIDYVDEPIFKSFEKSKLEILGLFKEKCNVVPGWNPIKKKRVQGEIRIRCDAEVYAYKFNESDITMRIGEKTDPLIVGADVLVYTLYKYFEKQNSLGNYVSLNSKSSLNSFKYKDVIHELCFSD